MNHNTLLRIDSSVRGEASVSHTVTNYLTEQLQQFASELNLIEHDLGSQPLPPMSAEQLRSVHGSIPSDDPAVQAQQALSDRLVDELMTTRLLVIGAPVYNFGVPAALKVWLDHICRARKTFRYSETGPVGLTDIDHAFVVVSSGGTAVGGPMDFVSPYLRHVLGFVGVKHVHIIRADGSGQDADGVIARARVQIDELLVGLKAEV